MDESDMDLKKDGDEGEGKALSATSSAGRALTPESLEGNLTDLDYARTGSSKRHHREKAKKSLTFSECVDILCEHRGLSTRDAVVVTETVFEMNGIPL
jgi:hypothetical protein